MPNPKNLFRLNNLTKQKATFNWLDTLPGTTRCPLVPARRCWNLVDHVASYASMRLTFSLTMWHKNGRNNQQRSIKWLRHASLEAGELIFDIDLSLSLSFCSFCRMVSTQVSMARRWKATNFYNQTSWWPPPQPKTHQDPLPNYEADTKNPQSWGNPASLWKLVKQFWAGMVWEDGSKHNKTRDFPNQEQLCLEVSNKIFGDPTKIGAIYPHFFQSEFKAHIESNEAAFTVTVRY